MQLAELKLHQVREKLAELTRMETVWSGLLQGRAGAGLVPADRVALCGAGFGDTPGHGR